MSQSAHVFNLDGRSLCDRFMTTEPHSLRPSTTQTELPMCGACVMAAEIYIAATRGTILASDPVQETAAESLLALASSRWAQTVDLVALMREANEPDREFYLFKGVKA